MIGARWGGARASSVMMLKGDASNRRFWRISIDPRPNHAPASAIAIDLGPDDLPAYVRTLNLLPEPPAEPPFLNVQRFLKSIGVAVPEIYAAAPERRTLLVEDVGETSLFDAALLRIDKPAALYRAAVDELLLIHVKGTRRLDSRCIAASIAYDERLFRWEMDQFLDAGSQWLGAAAGVRSLAPELDELAARFGRLPRVLSHRDYHGHNLFLQNGRIRVIDFQDALLAPAAQDLAVLLTTRDADRVIDPAAENRLLDYYIAGLSRREAPCPVAGEFRESYRLCVLQHALKVIGRFSYFESQGKTGYAAFIPHAVRHARRMLERHPEFPRLRSAFGVS
jgi:aminoglycoside/choline kinase family phosphotransferase